MTFKITKPVNLCSLLLLAMIFLTGCFGSKEIYVNTSVSGDQIELKKGQTLVVTLKSNPTTGYQWEIIEPVEPVMQQKGKVEFEPSKADDRPRSGKGGKETFRFKTKNRGETTLKLVYHRPWEEEVEPLKTFTLKIKVQ